MGAKPRARERASEVAIWHNPRCSKSRQTLELLRARGLEPTVREYLADPPSRREIEEALAMLGLPPAALVRKGEAVYRELGLSGASAAALVRAMADNPILIERPVVFCGKRAVLGRPPENVTSLL